MSLLKIKEVLKDTKVYRQRRLIKSLESGEEYTTSIRISDGRWGCSCKSWIFTHNKKGTDCKHLEELRRTYGNKQTSQNILDGLRAMAADLKRPGPKTARGALLLWDEKREQAEMLHYYFDNTPGKESEAAEVGGLIFEIKGSLLALATA